MNQDIDNLDILLTEFNRLTFRERKGKTIFEIAKFPQFERVWSNMLAFYLNPNAEHHLHELVLASLIESLDLPIRITNHSNIKIETEYPTNSGKLIDIVIISESYIIGIENKVNAGLYNDLSDYAAQIEALAKAKELPTYKIVLSKERLNPSHGFKNLTYSELTKTIRNRIGKYSDYSDIKYLIFLLDFLKNIENTLKTNKMTDNQEIAIFLQRNIEQVKKLLSYHNEFEKELISKLDNIDKLINHDLIGKELENISQESHFYGKSPNEKSGRFKYEGSELSKFTIKVGDTELKYQIGSSDYKLWSRNWVHGKNNRHFEQLLRDKGIDYAEYQYTESDEQIAEKITNQIIEIIKEISNNP
jgi:hypothetical protein